VGDAAPAAGLLIVAIGLLAYTWMGYPMLCAAVAAARARARGAAAGDPLDGPLPAVTVVIATRDEGARVAARVRDVLAASYPAERLDVIVAADYRAEHLLVGAPEPNDPRVRVVRGDAPGGKPGALNAGVRMATGEVLIFTDTSQRFAPTAIAELVHALRQEQWGAVSGALRLPGDDGHPSLVERYWRFERWLRRAEARWHSAVGVTGAIYAMPRALWTPLPADLILDDVFVPMRLVLAGRRVGFTDRAIASDDRRTEPEQEFRRKVRTLTGNIQLCAWMPGVLVPWRNPIWLQFVSHKLLRLLTPYLVVLALLAGAWLAALHVRPATLPVQRWVWMLPLAAGVLLVPTPRRRLVSALHWFAMMQAAVVVATVNGLRGRWDVWRA
jgi:cellulose synthase/poly-beta-1,6-N-acetylglucosamine synthase-like glycosyltransferase